jgi:hypothetical protein
MDDAFGRQVMVSTHSEEREWGVVYLVLFSGKMCPRKAVVLV